MDKGNGQGQGVRARVKGQGLGIRNRESKGQTREEFCADGVGNYLHCIERASRHLSFLFLCILVSGKSTHLTAPFCVLVWRVGVSMRVMLLGRE